MSTPLEPLYPLPLYGGEIGTIISILWFGLLWFGTAFSFWYHYTHKLRRNAVWQAVFVAALSGVLGFVYLTLQFVLCTSASMQQGYKTMGTLTEYKQKTTCPLFLCTQLLLLS